MDKNTLKDGSREIIAVFYKNERFSMRRFVSVRDSLLLLTENFYHNKKIVTSKKKFSIFRRKLASSNRKLVTIIF